MFTWITVGFINAKIITEQSMSIKLQQIGHCSLILVISRILEMIQAPNTRKSELRTLNQSYCILYVWVRSLCKPPPQQCDYHSQFCWFTCLPFPLLFAANSGSVEKLQQYVHKYEGSHTLLKFMLVIYHRKQESSAEITILYCIKIQVEF